MAERSNSEAEKAACKRIAQKLASVAMALALGVGFASPRDLQASVGHSATDSVYVMRNDVWPVFHRSLAPTCAGSSSGFGSCFPARSQQGRDRSMIERVDSGVPYLLEYVRIRRNG
jgi:hypothetical protein